MLLLKVQMVIWLNTTYNCTTLHLHTTLYTEFMLYLHFVYICTSINKRCRCTEGCTILSPNYIKKHKEF